MKFVLFLAFAVIATSAEDSENFKDFAVGNNLFAADVYHELLKSHSGNFLVCPLSAEIILALVHNGAGGATAEQLATGLHFPNDKQNIKERIQALLPYLKTNDKYTFTSANKMYVKDGYKVHDQFKSTAVDAFKSDVELVNFEKNDEAATTMNRWVEIQTNGKIHDLIDKDDLDEDTRAVLINAMYFHGKWIHAFPTRATIPQDFYPASANAIQVQMMQQLTRLNYYECPKTQAKFVELPYEGGDVTMTIVLPKEKDGLSALEPHIGKIFGEQEYTEQLVELKLPKFEIKSTIKFNSILKSFGVTEAFSDTADFDGILVDQPLKISKVIQKAAIEVEETGTVATAATAVEMVVPYSSNYVPPQVFKFVADHPFIYYIKIKNFVTFVGRYTGV